MSLTQNDEGGGGFAPGTAGSVCAISPSDLVGTVRNLISRIESLETTLSQVLGANLHASTLGDISSQVGWVYGVEYMGIPGWIQTEYGTLIPPPGFTMSGSGIQLFNACTGEFEDYQAVVMDEEGVLQWGATAAGNLCGEKVEAWNDAAAGGTADYYVYANGGLVSPNPTQNNGRNITITANNMAVNTNQAINNMTYQVDNDGVYHVHVSAHAQLANITGGDAWPYVQTQIYATGTGGTVQCDSTHVQEWPGNDAARRTYINHDEVIRMNAGQSVQIHANVGHTGSGTPGTKELTRVRTSIFRISSL